MSGLDVYEKVLKQLGGVGTGIINQSDFARDYTLEDEPCVRRQLERIGVC
jgi:hypothetical protein